jgi:hypothetical protein
MVLQINVDGSSLSNPSNVCSRDFLKNDRDIWIYSFFGSCSRPYNLVAGLSAIWRGLLLAWNLDYNINLLSSYNFTLSY